MADYAPVFAVLITGAITVLLHWRLGVRQEEAAKRERNERIRANATEWQREHALQACSTFLREAHTYRNKLRAWQTSKDATAERPSVAPMYEAIAMVRLFFTDATAEAAKSLHDNLYATSHSQREPTKGAKNVTISLFEDFADRSRQELGITRKDRIQT